MNPIERAKEILEKAHRLDESTKMLAQMLVLVYDELLKTGKKKNEAIVDACHLTYNYLITLETYNKLKNKD